MARTLIQIRPINSATNGLLIMAATFTSPVIDTWGMEGVSWEGLYTGTPTGTFTAEGSDSWDPLTNPNAVFITQPATTPALPAPAGVGGAFLVTSPAGPTGGCGRFQRLRYARTGGTGTMDLWIFASGAQ